MKVVSLFSGAGGSSGIAYIQIQGIIPKVLTRVFLLLCSLPCYVLILNTSIGLSPP